jgi:hypothetical protein
MRRRSGWIGVIVALLGPTGDEAAERRRAPPPATGFRVEAPGVYVWDESRAEIDAWRRDLGLPAARSRPPVACGACGRIRTAGGPWQRPRERVDPSTLSHGICPECARRRFPGLLDEDES